MFLTYILPILLLTYRDGHALPVPSSNATSLPWDSSMLLAVESTYSKPQVPRTLFSVTWSCILTTFICAWTSVHPNVPPQTRMGGLFARVKLMFWTIVAPELVLAWAVRQWFAARETRDTYNNSFRGGQQSKRWTTAHGHFLNMGGFKLVNEVLKGIREPPLPGWLSTSEEWERHYEYRCQLDEVRSKLEFGPLTLERFKKLVENPNVEFPTITAAEIKDRSKGDGLSKLIAMLQTSFFIAQCIARGLQGLALTELELVTLAMASLNVITFVFWWSKPLSVQEPLSVYVREEAREEAVQKDEEEVPEYVTARDVIENARVHASVMFDLRGYGWMDNWVYALGLYLIRLSYVVLTLPVFPLGILFLLWIIKSKKVEKAKGNEAVGTRVVRSLRMLRYKLTHSIRQYFGGTAGPLGKITKYNYKHPVFILNWFFVVPASFILLVLCLIVLSPLFTIFFIASFTFTAVFGIVTTNTVPTGATHVPSFYAPPTNSDRYSRMIVFAIFGVIFGGIHCIGWNFFFPTHSERFLWRYTSVALTVIPLVAAPIDYILENFKEKLGKMRLALDILMTVLLFLYVPARLSLITQALALLRDQPATALIAVDWTKYIPHLFN